MNSVLFFKIILFIAAIIISRLILKQVPNHLTNEQTALLAENSTLISLLRSVLLYGSAISIFILGRVSPEILETMQPIILIVLIIGMSLVVFLSYRKFNQLNLPAKARNLYVWSVVTVLVGIVILFLPIG